MSTEQNAWEYVMSQLSERTTPISLRGAISLAEVKNVYRQGMRDVELRRPPSVAAQWIRRRLRHWAYVSNPPLAVAEALDLRVRSSAGLLPPPKPVPARLPDFISIERYCADDVLLIEALRHTSTGRFTSAGPAFQEIPKEPNPTKENCMNHDEKIKAAEAALATALAQKEEADALAALTARLDSETELAAATATLLGAIRGIRLCGFKAQLNTTFAKFRKELAPLAESYGFRIKVVGDKTVAVLTEV